MGEVLSGGLSSFGLTLMMIAHLEVRLVEGAHSPAHAVCLTTRFANKALFHALRYWATECSCLLPEWLVLVCSMCWGPTVCRRNGGRATLWTTWDGCSTGKAH
jgi:hypothetical protein